MIASGEKKEEYREIKWYWISRLTTMRNFLSCVKPDIEADLQYRAVNSTLKTANAQFSKFDVVIFTNGYGKTAPSITVECKDIYIGMGVDLWGAPQGRCFIIKLGKQLKDFKNSKH